MPDSWFPTLAELAAYEAQRRARAEEAVVVAMEAVRLEPQAFRGDNFLVQLLRADPASVIDLD